MAKLLSGTRIYGNATVDTNLIVSGNTTSTSSGTGALTIAGGAGIVGNLNVGNILTVSAGIQNTPIGNGTASTGSFTTATASSSFNGPHNGTLGAAGGNTAIVSTLSSTSNATVAALTVNGTATIGTTLGVAGITRITDTTQGGSGTGALIVSGGGSFAKDLYVTGNVYTSNLIAINSSTLSVQDPLLYLTANTPYPYNYSIGFYSQYTGGNPGNTAGNIYQHTGFVRDNSDLTWKLFSNVVAEPSATVDFTNAQWEPVKHGNLTVLGTVIANSTASIGGNATVSALTVNNSATISSTLGVTGAITASSIATSGTTTGYLVNASGVSTGIALIAASGRSSGTTGALLYLGGNSNPSGSSGYLMNGQHTLSPQQDLSSWYGLLFLPTIQTFSGNIGSMYNEFLRLDTGATGNANITNWFGSFVATPSFTVGSAPVVNTWVGYYVQDPNNAVVNPGTAYAYRSNVNRGSNRWGAYFSGTADNYFAGNLGLGVTTPTSPLHVSGAGVLTGNLTAAGLTVNASATIGSTLGVTGATTIGGALSVTGNINLKSEGSDWARIYGNVSGSVTDLVLEVADDIGSGATDKIILRNYYWSANTSIDMLTASRVSNTTANIDIIGNINTTSIGVLSGGLQATPIGNVTPSTALFTTAGTSSNATVAALTVNGAATVGTTLGVAGNINGTSLTLTGSTVTTGPAQHLGGLQATPIGNAAPSTALFTTIGASSNATVAALTVNGAATVGTTLGVTGNATVGNLTTTGNVNSNSFFTGNRGIIGFNDGDSSNYVGFRAPNAVGVNVVWTLPGSDGSSGYILSTDGLGTLSWVANSGGGGSSTGGYFNSTLTAFPGASANVDYGLGETYVGQAATLDAFGISLVAVYSCNDPTGSIQSADLGAV